MNKKSSLKINVKTNRHEGAALECWCFCKMCGMLRKLSDQFFFLINYSNIGHWWITISNSWTFRLRNKTFLLSSKINTQSIFVSYRSLASFLRLINKGKRGLNVGNSARGGRIYFCWMASHYWIDTDRNRVVVLPLRPTQF